jgi:hypothetical protein
VRSVGNTRAERAARLGDTQLPRKVAKATLEFPWVRVSQI